MKSTIWITLLLLAAAGGVAVFYGVKQPSGDETAVITNNTIRRSVRGTGLIEGKVAEIQLKFPIPGRVEDVSAIEGHEVASGDLLAELNSAYMDVQIEQQEAALAEATARAEMVKAPKSPEVIAQCDEKLRQASDEVKGAHERLKALQAPPPPPRAPQAQIEDASRAIDVARQKLALADAALKQIKAGPTPDELAIAQAKVELARSEYDGAVKLLQESKSRSFFPKETLAQLEVNVETTKRKLELAQAEFDKVRRGPKPEELDAATARVALAQIELDGATAAKARLEIPPAPPPAPDVEIKSAEVALSQAQARERQAKAALDELKRAPEEAEVKAAVAARDKADKALTLLKLNKEGFKLTAPFDGLITRRHVESGSMVQPNEPIVSMTDFSQKRVRAEFDVVWLKEIKSGMKATFKSRAFGKDELLGKVLETGKVGSRKILLDDPRETRGGEVVEIILEIEDPKSELKKPVFAMLKPGLRVEVDVTLDVRTDVISAPKSFIWRQDDREFVWRVERDASTNKAGGAKMREVKCGLRDEGYVEIIEGLSAGDVIVKPKAQNK